MNFSQGHDRRADTAHGNPEYHFEKSLIINGVCLYLKIEVLSEVLIVPSKISNSLRHCITIACVS